MRSVSLILVLAAIATPAAAIDRGLGLVTQNNLAAMAVDLNPAYAQVKIEGGAGTVADGAISRYRDGKVKPLLPLSGKSDVGMAAAMGGGGNAGPGNDRGSNTSGGPR